MIAPDLVEALVDALTARLGAAHVKIDEASRTIYGTDALKRGSPADIVVFPGSTEDVASVVRLCAAQRVPIVPRGGGTARCRAHGARGRAVRRADPYAGAVHGDAVR